MRVGALRHKIVIEHFTATRNAYGEEIKVWSLFAEAYAEIKPIKADEFFSARGLEHEVTHRVIIRYLDGVTADMRISHDGRLFEIVGIRDFFERKRTLEIMCKEIRNG